MSDNPFDPEVRRFARLAPHSLVRPKTLGMVRFLSSLAGPRGVQDVEVHTLSGDVGVRLHRAPDHDGPTPALLWLHGGGYVLGSARLDDDVCKQFTRRLGIAVAAVEYRLAPENPYPAGLEDSYTALKWLAAQPNVDPTRVAIGGASAGGGLAAALALLARDRGEIPVALQLLRYPMLDDRTVSQAEVKRHYRLWDEKSNRFGWASYLGKADPDTAVPARRHDLAGLPAAWIGVGTLDLFHGEDITYAKRLSEAGVPCTLEVVPGVFHGFDDFLPHANISRTFFESQCTSLRDAFNPEAARE
jgi:acetyl esterase/lipase